MQVTSETRRAKENELILGIYNLPIETLLVSCCHELGEIIPYDHSFSNLNDRSNRFKAIFNCKSEDTDDETLDLYENYYHTIDFLSWCYNQAQPMVFRATDLVYPEVIEESRIHKEWQSRIGIFYTVTACIASNGILYGTISLMRSKAHGDFTDDEMDVLGEINNHLCNRFKLAYPNGVNRFMMDSSTDPIAAKFSLTPREWEVTCLLIHGMSRADIAKKLCISTNTLKRHVANIYRKVGVSNAGQFFAALSNVEKSVESRNEAGGGHQRKLPGIKARAVLGFRDARQLRKAA